MGKKPVFAMVGLVWAGMALTGCGLCSNCRNGNTKYSAAPTFQTRNTKTDAATPTMVGDAKAGPMDEAPRGKQPDAIGGVGATKPAVIEPVSGTSTGPSGVVPASAPPTRPTSQSSLRPTEERGDPFAPLPPPKALDDGFPSRLTSSGDARPMTVPPRPAPMNPAATTTPAPAVTAPTTTPAPAASTPPPMPGSSLPPINPSSSGFENGSAPPMPSYQPGK